MESLAETVVKNTKEKVPLGTLLLADELILPQDLELALEHQKFSRQLLGEILIRIGALTRAELDKTLNLQSSLRFDRKGMNPRENLRASYQLAEYKTIK
ncbi:MAG: hypothetical protein ACM3MD_03055 [Betaproteobacteria bacterium]